MVMMLMMKNDDAEHGASLIAIWPLTMLHVDRVLDRERREKPESLS